MMRARACRGERWGARIRTASDADQYRMSGSAPAGGTVVVTGLLSCQDGEMSYLKLEAPQPLLQLLDVLHQGSELRWCRGDVLRREIKIVIVPR